VGVVDVRLVCVADVLSNQSGENAQIDCDNQQILVRLEATLKLDKPNRVVVFRIKRSLLFPKSDWLETTVNLREN